MRGRSRALSLLAVVVLVAACDSSGHQSPSTSPTAAALVVDSCATGGQHWTAVTGVSVPAAQLGSGPTVVLANESNDDVCDWMPVTMALVQAGLRAVVFSYDNKIESESVRDVVAVARAASGTGPYALAGASVGGRIVIEAAAGHPVGLAAIVSLSGERELPAYPDILPSARAVTTPALYVGTVEDGYTQGRDQQNQLHTAMHGNPNVQLQLAGSAHGVQMLDLPTPGGATVQGRLVTFVRTELRR